MWDQGFSLPSGVWRVWRQKCTLLWTNGVDVEVGFYVSVEDKFAPVFVDADVIDSGDGACGMLPCPAVVGMDVAEGGWQEDAVPVDEFNEVVGVLVGGFGVEIANMSGGTNTNSGIGVNEGDEVDVAVLFGELFG